MRISDLQSGVLALVPALPHGPAPLGDLGGRDFPRNRPWVPRDSEGLDLAPAVQWAHGVGLDSRLTEQGRPWRRQPRGCRAGTCPGRVGSVCEEEFLWTPSSCFVLPVGLKRACGCVLGERPPSLPCPCLWDLHVHRSSEKPICLPLHPSTPFLVLGSKM